MIIEAYKIEYATDGEHVDLPSSIQFEVGDGFNPDDELADLITDHTGWLVQSLKYRTV